MTDATYAPPGDVDGTLVADRLHWVLSVLAGRGPGLGTEPARHFVPAFLERHADVGALFDAWRALGPFTVESTTPLAHKAWATLVGAGGARYSLAMTIDTSGLLRRVEIDPEVFRRIPRALSEVDDVLTRDDVTSTALVCRRVGEHWEVLYERSPGALMPTGSVFKVFVLLAVARAVRDGDARWDDEIVLGPRARSLPTGEMQDLPDGTRTSLYQAAHNMFARSDNTASDLVIGHIGRDAVHRAVAAAGHHRPDALRPFPTSRELFEIGWGRQELLTEWQDGDEAARERLLDRIDGPLTTRIPDLTYPAYQRGLDWFASAWDVCHALSALWQAAQADRTGRIRDILAVYSGVEMDRDRWPITLFKGGSTPGVVMFCWLLLDRHDVEHAVVLMQSADRVGVLKDGLPLRRLGDLIIHGLIR